MSENKQAKVFISYSWAEPRYGCEWVEQLAGQLRQDGIDADIDQYYESPPEGWTTWIMNQIKDSDYVLVVSSQSYYETVNSGKVIDCGLGRRFEGKLIQTAIYNEACVNSKFIPILPCEDYRKFTLDILKDYTAYSIDNNYDKLKDRLRGVSPHKPPLGEVNPMPAKEVKTLFSTLIDPILWSRAEWYSIGFEIAVNDNEIPFLKFTYRNAEEAIELFKNLNERIGKGNNKSELGISFIENEDSSGIIVHIYPILINVIKSVEDNKDYSIEKSITISRTLRLDGEDAIKMVNRFQQNYNVFNSCYIVPYAKVNGEMRYAEDLKILMRNVRFRKFNEICSTGDIDIAVNPSLAEKLIKNNIV